MQNYIYLWKYLASLGLSTQDRIFCRLRAEAEETFKDLIVLIEYDQLLNF